MSLIRDIYKRTGEMLWGSSPFESANQSPRRSPVKGSSPTDFNLEFNSSARLETVRKCRYLAKNSGFFREQSRLMDLYSVGSGIKAQAQTRNTDLNRRYEDYFSRWGGIADLSRRFSFYDLQSLACSAIDTDGELFLIKTRDPSTGRRVLQVVESHRVGDFGYGDSHDGVLVDSVGRPKGYRVLLDNGNHRVVPASSMIHVFDAEAASAYRHPPTLAHAVNHLIDEYELLALEKHAVKDNADITRILTNSSGQLDENGDFNPTGDTGANDGSDAKALQNIVGGKLVALQAGETIESFESKRPSSTFTGFLSHILRDSSLGMLPYEFVVDPSGINAGAVRLITAKVERITARRTEAIFRRLVQPAWFYIVGSAIDSGEMTPIRNWWRIKAGTPRKITVDAGRNEESVRRDVEMGLRTPGDSYIDNGDDFEAAMERKADQIKMIEAVAARKGVDPEKLFDFDFGAKAKGVAGTPPSPKNPK